MTDTKDALGRAVSRRGFLATSALAGASVAGSGALLAACGDDAATPTPGGAGSGDGTQRGGQVTWASWANPGEAERFREYSKDYEQRFGTKVTYQVVSGDYLAKLLTQLAGGSATDAFYVGDTQMIKLIESNALQPLDDYLASADAALKWDDVFKGLKQWCVGPDGKKYGVPVDCNPIVLWFNRNILKEAGVTTDPAAQQEAGTWTRAALTDTLTKIKATGKTPATIENGWWGFWMGYLTCDGGTLFDDSGRCVADTDPKALENAEWLVEQLKNGNIVYGGALPKGQGVDALFYAGQLGILGYGRWVLPNLKKVKSTIDYDIAPLPSADGKSIPIVPVGTAAMSVNAKAKNPENGLHFLGHYVSAEGQKFRLSGGGNAVPVVPGLDEIVTEGNEPAHGSWFIPIAEAGYATPKPLYSNAEKGAKLPQLIDSVFLPEPLKTMTGQMFATKLAEFMNA